MRTVPALDPEWKALRGVLGKIDARSHRCVDGLDGARRALPVDMGLAHAAVIAATKKEP